MSFTRAAFIRPYQPNDRAAVFRIASDTAFFGEPLEIYMEDRRLFCDAFYSYYTDFEPQHGWTACAGNQVIGFLMGCTDTRAYQHILILRILPSIIYRYLRGSYRLGPQSWRYLRGLLNAAFHHEFPEADLQHYPAHLHINLDAGWRGQGLGRRLMEAYLDQLGQVNISGVHLHTSSMNTAACALYEKAGFYLLDKRTTHIWDHLLESPVENRCYGKKLNL